MTDARRRTLTLTLVLCCVAQFMIVLDVSIVNVALPSISDELGFTSATLSWVVNAYTLTFAGFLLLADFSNRTHTLLLITTIAVYTILAFGLVALGTHVNRNTLRVLKAIELLGQRDER